MRGSRGGGRRGGGLPQRVELGLDHAAVFLALRQALPGLLPRGTGFGLLALRGEDVTAAVGRQRLEVLGGDGVDRLGGAVGAGVGAATTPQR